MSNKELSKYLENTKVYVAGKSKEIQEKLFELGYGWIGSGWTNGNSHVVSHISKPYLYLYKSHIIKFGTDMISFYDDEFREVTVDEILNN